VTKHLTSDELHDRLGTVAGSPLDVGTVEMIVRRPDIGDREEVANGELVVGEGLIGDNYVARGSTSTDDGSAHPEAQLNVMNSRIVDLVSGGERDRWKLAGDQLLVDMDLSVENLPPGTRLAIGDAVIEVSMKPHNGCAKFADRYGIEAARWINSRKDLRLRGLNAMVVHSGTIAAGDDIRKL